MQSSLLFQKFDPGKQLTSPPIQAVEEDGVPAENRLHVFDKNTNTKFLVDSGSVISLLPKATIKKKLKRHPMTLTAANSSSIATYGTHSMELNLRLRRAFTWNFTVADVQSAILGADFLKYFNLLVDLPRSQLIDASTGLSSKGFAATAPVHSVVVVNRIDAPPGDLGKRYDSLLREYHDITQTDGAPAELPDLPVRHQIHTTGPPVYERPRRLVGPRLVAAKDAFKQLLQMGIIRPSSSQWASPLHLVPKSTGTWRTTGDYRRLNAVTIPDRYPLPIIEDLLQEVSGKVYSVIDLWKSYYQFRITDEDIPKTAVTTPFGLFEFTRSSMGLRNSAQSLQRAMDHLFGHMPFVRVYLDDIIIFSEDHHQHLEHLRQVFDVLRRAKLHISLQKCSFGKPELIFLGFHVSADGYKPPPHKIEAIGNFPRPKDSTELRRYMGLFNYYHRCIPKAAEILAPLNDLLRGLPQKKKKIELNWTPEADAAFQRSKLAISEATTSSFLKADAPLALRTDASDTCIGAALEQQDEQGRWFPLGFFSKKLSDTEKRYSAYDRELLAIYAAIKDMQRILEGRNFTVYTDHKPLVFAASQRSDKASPRQARQLDFILQFNTKLVHVKGEENTVADALSRIATVSMPSTLNAETIATAQSQDEEMQHVMDNSSLRLQPLSIDGVHILCDTSHDVVRPYLPSTLRRTAFEVLHNLAHPSVKATVRLVSSKFVWPGMRKEVNRWARSCEHCQRAKVHRHNRSALGNFNTPDGRFDHIHIDIIQLPLCQSFHYCLTVIDRFTRWPEAIPLPDKTTITVAKALIDRWISRYGTPLTITSDQGMQFESALFTELAKLLGASRIRTTPYHPISNGMVERVHRTLKAALMCSPESPWPDLLPLVLLGLRTSFKEDLQASPAELLYGTTLRVPGEFFVTNSHPEACPSTFVEELRSLARSIKATPASRHISERTPFFFKDLRTCSHVFKRVDSIRTPLKPPYTGPHRIVRRVDERTYVIDINGQHSTVSTDALKPAHLDVFDEPTQPQTSASVPESTDQRDPVPPAVSQPSSPPAVLQPSSPPAETSQPLPALKTKKVTFSFSPSPTVSTGRGVAVAPSANTPGRATHRRKQQIVVRQIFATA